MKFFAVERQLFEKRSGDWVVQVFEKGDRRELRFGNNIVQSAYSLAAPDMPVLDYARAMLASLLFVPQPEYVLHLGLGAGSVPRFIHRFFPTVRQRVAEINRDVIDAAYGFFDFPDSSRLLVTEQDAREFVARSGETYDLIFVDAFVAVGASAGFNETSFFKALRARLGRRGWVVNNVWGSDEENLRRVNRVMTAVFPSLYAVSVLSHSNVIFIGSPVAEALSRSVLVRRAAALGQAIPFDFAQWVPRIRPLGMAQRTGGGGVVAKA
ncbi:MAG: fused MFS/spermidine synthase [bacterium]